MGWFNWLDNIVHAKCKTKEHNLNMVIKELHNEKFSMQQTISNQNHKIYELKEQLNPPKPILPEEMYKTSNIMKGKRLYFTKNKRYYYTFKNAQDYFTSSDELPRRELQRAKANTGTHFERFSKIIRHISKNHKYEYDSWKFGETENWENIDSLIITKTADCETANILAVKLCRMAGIPANKIFVTVGEYYNPKLKKQFGHAWTVFQDTKGVWWVGDATNGMLTVTPWTSVKDKYYAIWGLFNDVFSCKLKGDETYLGE